MGSSSDKNLKENKYKCSIILGKAEVPGFLCDFIDSSHKKLDPTIITYKDLFPEDFDFKEENKYIMSIYGLQPFEANLKILLISDNYNIVIFKILNFKKKKNCFFKDRYKYNCK